VKNDVHSPKVTTTVQNRVDPYFYGTMT